MLTGRCGVCRVWDCAAMLTGRCGVVYGEGGTALPCGQDKMVGCVLSMGLCGVLSLEVGPSCPVDRMVSCLLFRVC